MPHSPRRWAIVALLVAGCLAAACGDDPPVDESRPGALRGEATVFAASSLTEAFKEAGAAFQTANPGAKVTFNFAASSALAVQINEGARANVFASADDTQMAAVVDRGNATASRPLAHTRPVVITPKGSSEVKSFADLARPGLRLVLAAADVPIGRYAREILSRASSADGGVSPDFSSRVLTNLKSNEPNVRAVLAKVQLGEADVGIVYRTDVVAGGGEVDVVEVPERYNVTAEYSIALVPEPGGAAVGMAFIEFVLSAAGQAILGKAGFTAP